MRRLFNIFIAALACLVSGCTLSLDKLVKNAATHCPIPVEGVGFVKDITLSGDTLIYHCVVTNTDVDIEKLKSNSESVKRVMEPQILTLFDNNPELLEAVRSNKLVLSARYYGSKGGAPLSIDFSPEELSGKKEAPPTFSVNPVQRLVDEIAVSRAGLPTKLAEGIDIVDIDTLNSMVTFFCNVNESLAGTDAIKNLRENAAEIRAEMLSAFTSRVDPEINTLVNMSTDAGCGIAYCYTGSLTGDTLNIIFRVEDLKK